MKTKLATLKEFAANGDWQKALRLAASFADLGDHRGAIKRGHEAFSNGRFYTQLGQDPEALKAAGIAALIERYKLTPLIEGEPTMTTETTLSAADIAKLTAMLTGGGYKRAANKDAAIKRFQTVAAEKGVDGAAILAAADPKDALARAINPRTPSVEKGAAAAAESMAKARATLAKAKAERAAPKAEKQPARCDPRA